MAVSIRAYGASLRLRWKNRLGAGAAQLTSRYALRSNKHGEHETKRYAPGPEPISPAATQIAPAGYRLPRQGTLGVFDPWCTTIAPAKPWPGRPRRIDQARAPRVCPVPWHPL